MVAEARATRLEPYLPRLARAWARERPDDSWLELDCTLVSADVSGFTALSERLQSQGRAGAEELVLLVSGCFEGLIGIAERLGGDVLKFRGDALLVLFSGEGHERRASFASADMQWFIENAAPARSSVGPVALKMAVGVHSGPCHVFLAGTSHRELVVAGPASTATVILEDAAAAGEVLVSAATAAALEPEWVGEEREGGSRVLRAPANAGAEEALAPPLPSGRALDDYVPEPVRAALTMGSSEGEHRRATVAFVRFGGIDALLEREGQAAVAERIAALGDVVGSTTDDLGVTWLESDVDRDGGKLYLVAGAPASRGSDEERMLRALREIVDRAPPELAVRAGVNRGPVFAGEIGSAARRTYAVLGDTVNLAARLCGRAERGQVLATGDVLERAHARFETTAQPFLVKGKERAVTAFSVGALTGEREAEPQRALPIVGREAELALLREAVDRARRRIGQVVEIVGEPGIGKSRLVEELKTIAIGFAQLEARCGQYAASAPYFPFRAILRPLAGLTPEDRGDDAGERLRTWIEAVMPDLAQWLPLLAIPFDVPVPPTPEVDELDPAFRMERMHDAIATFLERVLMMPTLILIEDSHWLDDASLALVRHLISRPAPRPWLAVGTRRPEGARLAEGEAAGATLIELQPLPAHEAKQLALAAAGEAAVSEEALAEVTGRAGGNPLFVRELIGAMRDTSADELPETVERVITARIDTLAPRDRQLLRYASVIGAVFELDLLAEVVGDDVGDVRDLARWDAVGQFVEWDGPSALRFRHDLFRAAAYEGLPFRRRREIHGRLADALVARAATPDAMADLLSLHFLRAERFEEAWRYSVRAGDQARTGYANAVAVQLYERALDAAPHIEIEAAEVARIAETLGDVAELAAQYERAEEAYAQAHRLANETETWARLDRKRGVLSERGGRYDEAVDWLARGLRSLGEGDDLEWARIELELAAVRFRQGKMEESMEHAYRAVGLAERTGDRSALGRAYYQLASAHERLGRAAETNFHELALGLLTKPSDLVARGHLLNNIGIGAYWKGDWDEALSRYEESREVKNRAGDVVNAAAQTNNVAEILSDQGRLAEAADFFREALRVWQAARYAIGIALAKSNLGRLAARDGRFPDAQGLLAEALVEFQTMGAETFVVETLARRAEAHVFAGEYREAAAVLDETETYIDRGTVYAHILPLVHRLRGYALIQARERESARAPLEESLARARALEARYEIALTLRALADLDGDDALRAESDALLAGLGVVSTPRVPLP